MATLSISYGDFEGSNVPPLTIEYQRKRILVQGHDPHSSLIHWFSTTILWCLIHLHTQVHNPMSSITVWKRYKIGYIKINLAELRYTSGRGNKFILSSKKGNKFVFKERKQIYHLCSSLPSIEETRQRRKACPIFTWIKNVILLISRWGLEVLARFMK